MPGMTLQIPPKSTIHARLRESLETRLKLAESALSKQTHKWDRAEQNVAAYVPVTADDAKREVDRDDEGVPRYTTIKLPYTYALLMAAHTYWTSVFFARSPVHQFTGRHGETQMSVQALEALISYQTQVGMLLGPYYLWAYDAGKYGVGILGTYWDTEVRHYSQMALDEKGQQVYVTNAVPGYQGNRVYNVSPYDFLPDPRVPVGQFQRGEFCAVYRELSWNEMLMRASQGYYMNTDQIKEAPTRSRNRATGGEYLERPEAIDKSELATHEQKHPAWVGVYEVYVTLIPSEWGVGAMNMPEKWVFTITSDCETILQAQPMGMMHCRYPFDVWESEPEAYGLWSRGIPEIITPIQNTMDWLINSHFYNVRAVGVGRFVADPSKIDLAQLEEGEAGWIAALRPEAWGQVTDIRQVFMQLPTQDPTANHFADAAQMFTFGERATGINEQILGALGAAGSRRTATEVRTATGFGTNRLKTSAEYMSATGFAPHTQMLVQNSQQFLAHPVRVKIVGDLMQQAGPSFVDVTPEAIAGFYDFVPVDGTLPVDRFAQATLWKDILGQLRGFPQLMAQFDLGKIFSWVSGLAGLKNLDQFRIAGPQVQVLPDQVLQDEAQRGNVIPYPGGQSNVASTPTTNVGLPI